MVGFESSVALRFGLDGAQAVSGFHLVITILIRDMPRARDAGTLHDVLVPVMLC